MTRVARLGRFAALGVAFVAAGSAHADEPVVGGPCQGCDAVFVGKPAKLASISRIAPADEPGEPLRLSGVVTGPDGKPRAGIIVYAYQTDAKGIYPRPEKSLGGWADRHGRLRGWAVTDREGRYTFDSIRPASYPSQAVEQHIHMHVIEPGCGTYYIDNVNFADDPLLPANERGPRPDARAGSGLATPTRDAAGTWLVTRDIRLGLNIPGYACHR